MHKRKHTNGCLLRLLSFFASLGFLVLAGLFGVYLLSERPTIATENGKEQEVSSALKSQDHTRLKDGLEASKEAFELSEEGLLTDQASFLEEGSQTSLEEETDVLLEYEEEAVTQEETGESSSTSQDITAFEEVSLYDEYILTLDENIVGTMGNMYNDGQIDYKSIVTKLFSNLAFSDQLRLLNIILSKVQTVNINEVWDMIKDGIDEEESIKLQQLVQANFTKEELDELYMYYQAMEMVESIE